MDKESIYEKQKNYFVSFDTNNNYFYFFIACKCGRKN